MTHKPMDLSADFQFSQASLQDYVDCPRRFYLRHVLQLPWPAIQVEPVQEHEQQLERGQAFHRLVYQYVLGIPVARLTRSAQADPDLARWWEHFLAARPADLPGRRFPEQVLSAPAPVTGAYRLMAKYDLITATPEGHAVIFDWKTSPRQPHRARLLDRLQTRVYRYLLVRAGAALNAGRAFIPDQVTMIYWFSEYPDEPVVFLYGGEAYAADEARLVALIGEILACTTKEDFALTGDERRCKYCTYRSLCDRGEYPGLLTEFAEEEAFEEEDAAAFDLDFDQIAEIAF
ncbi:MAG: PD-(D/E)XK nuclease family protein [Anaerolineae bacterium]|nr:PD-(D/E)XK nuclease family protein [Anaerolineae bacterium]